MKNKMISLGLVLIMTMCMIVPSVLAELSSLLPYEGEPVVYHGFWDENNATRNAWQNDDYPIKGYFDEKFGNVKVEWEAPSGDAATKLDLMLATGDLPDIIVTVYMHQKKLKYNMENFLNLRDYTEYAPNIMSMYENYPALQNLYGPNEEVNWIPQLVVNDNAAIIYFAQQDNLDALGLETPQTWEEMLDSMRAFKAANPDDYPFLICYNWGLSLYISAIGNILGFSNGVYFNEQTDKWDYMLVNQEDSKIKEAIAALALMVEEGLLDPNALSRTTEQGYEVFRTGKWLYNYAYSVSPSREAFTSSEVIPFNCVPMITPSYNDTKGGIEVIYHSGMYDYDGGAISANVQNPELLVSLVDAWNSLEIQMLNNFGVEGLTYEVDPATGTSMFINGYDSPDKRTEFGLNKNIEVDGMFKYVQWQPATLPNKPIESLTHSDLADRSIVKWLNEGLIRPIDNPRKAALSDEMNDLVSANITPISTYVNEAFYQFVEGDRPMSEWDDFVKEALSYGDINKVLEAYDSAEQVSFSTDYKWLKVPNDY